MGATMQATLYSEKEKKIVKSFSDPTVRCVSGRSLLTNGQINFLSSAMLTTIVGVMLLYNSATAL